MKEYKYNLEGDETARLKAEKWWLTETESGKEIDFFIPEGKKI